MVSTDDLEIQRVAVKYGAKVPFYRSKKTSDDFANTYVREVIALHPRTEALETPINVTKEQATGWSGHTYMETKITTVDNNGG